MLFTIYQLDQDKASKIVEERDTNPLYQDIVNKFLVGILSGQESVERLYAAGIYQKNADVEADKLEEVFEICQNFESSWLIGRRVKKVYPLTEYVPSLSVGDIVQCGDEWKIVASMGYVNFTPKH